MALSSTLHQFTEPLFVIRSGSVVVSLCVLGCTPIKKHINRTPLHRSGPSQMDSGERNVLWLPEGHGCYKEIA